MIDQKIRQTDYNRRLHTLYQKIRLDTLYQKTTLDNYIDRIDQEIKLNNQITIEDYKNYIRKSDQIHQEIDRQIKQVKLDDQIRQIRRLDQIDQKNRLGDEIRRLDQIY